MNPEELLQQLAPLRAPTPIAWWPPAIGWWLLIAAIVGLIALGVFFWLRHRRTQRYRRQALKVLEQLIEQRENNAATLNRLLKTIAMYEFSSPQVAALSGSQWLDFLSRHCPALTTKQLAPLGDSYRPDAEQVDNVLTDIVKCWIKQHEVKDV